MAVTKDSLREKLLAERDRVQAGIAAENQRRVTLSDTADHEGYGNHPGDQGTETFEKEKSVALQRNLQVILDEVEHALRKFDNGTYGQCDNCGMEIPLERLEIRPQATLCITCKSKVEHIAQVAQAEALHAR